MVKERRADVSTIGLIAGCTNSPEPEKIMDVSKQVSEISKSLSILLQTSLNISSKKYEREKLEQELKEARAISESTNMDIQIISEYKELKKESSEYRLSTEDPANLLTALRNICLGLLSTGTALKTHAPQEKLLEKT
jgi:hypothetical protein